MKPKIQLALSDLQHVLQQNGDLDFTVALDIVCADTGLTFDEGTELADAYSRSLESRHKKAWLQEFMQAISRDREVVRSHE